MGRVINPERAGQQRTQLTRMIVLAVRELVQKKDIDGEVRDLAAFISLALLSIWEGIEASVTPWEKRGYWIKADKFRLEWDWTHHLGLELQKAVLAEDWPHVAQITAQVAGKLNNVKLPQHNRLGTPWSGAWQRISDQSLHS